MISRAGLLAGTAAAFGYLALTSLSYQGALEDRIALVFAIKLFLVFLIALHAVVASGRPSARWLLTVAGFCERHAGSILVVTVVGSVVVAFLTTPQIGFGEGELGLGYGDDGHWYGFMTEHFAWFRHDIPGAFGSRFLPPMLVHYSGLNTFQGFKLLNLVSHALTAVLAYRIARHFGFPRFAALMAVWFLTVLKFGLKFVVYYPVLTDGLGLLLLMAIVWATLEKRHAIYLVAMLAAVGTRENLVVLTLFNALHLVRTSNRPRRLVIAAALQLPVVALFFLSRTYPIFPPWAPAGLTQVARASVTRFLLDPAKQDMYFLAFVNSLGIVGILPLLSWRRVATFLGERYEWAYFVAANLAVSIVGAGDFDRFMVWLAPVAILTLLVGDFSGGSPPRLCMHWLLLHVIAMEFFLPWFPDRDFYLSRYATHASGAGFAYIAVFSWVLIAVAVAIRVNEPPSRLTEATV